LRRCAAADREAAVSSAIAPKETTTQAIVVRARVFGDADKIVTFLTRDLGKLSGIAKGAKHSKRRFVNVLEPFTHVRLRVRLRPASDLAFVSACELIEAPRTFTRELRTFAFASYMLELTDRMVRGREAGPETYELVRDALALLDRSTTEDGLLRGFELHLLRVTGYEPALDRCRRCGVGLSPDRGMYAQPAHGGLLCGRCRGDGRSYVISRATLERLRALQQTSFDAVDASGFALEPGVAAEARALLRSFFAAALSGPLVSERLLEEV
jgi:DNA repair protein RecO (recombination protein O)